MTKYEKRIVKKGFSILLLAVIVGMALALGVFLPTAAGAEAVEVLPVSADLMEVMQEYAVMPVVVFCCIIGAVLKNAFETFNNKLIPVVLIPVGVVCVLWMNNWQLSPDTVFAGACSAMLSVGLHSTGKHVLEAFKPPEQ